MKKSPEKLLSNYRKNSRIHKQIENFSHNQSKYECSNKVDDLNSNTNNSVYFNEKNGIHTIKFKQNLEASKNENDDSLNFTYFSKEIALINEKKHEGYLVLKGYLENIVFKLAILAGIYLSFACSCEYLLPISYGLKIWGTSIIIIVTTSLEIASSFVSYLGDVYGDLIKNRFSKHDSELTEALIRRSKSGNVR